MKVKHPRFILFLGVFGTSALLAAFRLEAHAALILGFDLGALVFFGSCLPLWLSDNPDAIRARGARDGNILLAWPSPKPRR